MRRQRIAIATCAGYDDLKADDRLLAEALAARTASAVPCVWDGAQPDWSEFDACLLRSTWDYHDSYEEFLSWTRRVAAATRLWSPPDLVAWNSYKTYLRELAEAGVPTVPTVWVERGSDAEIEAILAAEDWQEAVVKPVVDLGAKNLHRVRAGRGEAAEALQAVLERHNAMVQPFLPALEQEGELSLIYIEGTFSHAVRKRPAKGDFRVQSIWGGTAEATNPTNDQRDLASRTLAHLNDPPLYARIDLVTDLTGNPALIELELIEPNLYLSTHPSAAETLAKAILNRL